MTGSAPRRRPGHTPGGRSPWSSLRDGHEIDLGGTRAATFAYGDAVPGPLIRANVGDELAVTVNGVYRR